MEVVYTCSHRLPQAVATLYVAVFFCCTVMYTYWVSKRGCRRYHWVYNAVCYDCEERLTWCYEGWVDEQIQDWNLWTIYNDQLEHVGNYSWWGIWDSPDSNLLHYDDPGLTLVKDGETVEFSIFDHVERLLAAYDIFGRGRDIDYVAEDASFSEPEDPMRPLLCAP